LIVFVTAFRVPAALAAFSDLRVSSAPTRTRAAEALSLRMRTRSRVPTMLKVARLSPKTGAGAGVAGLAVDTTTGAESSEVPSPVVAVAATEEPSVAVTGIENVAVPPASVVTVRSPSSA
jgi:hypothetical protein